MHAVAGIASLDIPAAFRAATRRITLHAAVYGNFANSQDHADALETALARPDFERLDVISVRPETDSPAMQDFMSVLRDGWDNASMREHFAASRAFLARLAAKYKGRVHLYESDQPGLFPALIMDDTLIFGQYAHAPAPAPQGFWFSASADVQKLEDWLQSGSIPQSASPHDLAALRIVSECRRAMDAATDVTALFTNKDS